MTNGAFPLLRVKIDEWLSVNSNLIDRIESLEKLAWLLFIASILGGSEFLFWCAILIGIYVTYLNWRYK